MSTDACMKLLKRVLDKIMGTSLPPKLRPFSNMLERVASAFSRDSSESDGVLIGVVRKVASLDPPIPDRDLYALGHIMAVIAFAPLSGTRAALTRASPECLRSLIGGLADAVPTGGEIMHNTLNNCGPTSAVLRRFFASAPSSVSLPTSYFKRACELGTSAIDCWSYDDLVYDIVLETRRAERLAAAVGASFGSTDVTPRSLGGWLVAHKDIVYSFAQSRQRHSHAANFPDLDDFIVLLAHVEDAAETAVLRALKLDAPTVGEFWRLAMLSPLPPLETEDPLIETLRGIAMGPMAARASAAPINMTHLSQVPGELFSANLGDMYINARTLWYLQSEVQALNPSHAAARYSKSELILLAEELRGRVVTKVVQGTTPTALHGILSSMTDLTESTLEQVISLEPGSLHAIAWRGNIPASVVIGMSDTGTPIHLLVQCVMPIDKCDALLSAMRSERCAASLEEAAGAGHSVRIVFFSEKLQGRVDAHVLLTYSSATDSTFDGARSSIMTYLGRSAGSAAPDDTFMGLKTALYDLFGFVFGCDLKDVPPIGRAVWTPSHYTIQDEGRGASCVYTRFQDAVRMLDARDRVLVAVDSYSGSVENAYICSHREDKVAFAPTFYPSGSDRLRPQCRKLTRTRDKEDEVLPPIGFVTGAVRIRYFHDALRGGVAV
jgi:hypothetical protein